MPNILLTTSCVRSCPYCFAKTQIAGAVASEWLGWEHLVYIADFLLAGGERRVSLLGGEPTLHPEFVDMTLYLLERGFDVTVFTSGVMSSAKLRQLEEFLPPTDPRRLSFVCNLNDPELTPCAPKEAERVSHFLHAMGPRVTPGFNIYHTGFRLEFLFDLVNRHGLVKHLRLGIAHPAGDAETAHIRPDEIGAVAERLYGYRAMFERFRVSLGLDCGFPMCRFTDEQIGWLYRVVGPNLRFHCRMALDITPNMEIYNCFPLARFHRRSLFEFDSLQQVVEFYGNVRKQIRAEIAGIYPECDGCAALEDGICDGGGSCQLLQRFGSEPWIRLAEIEHELAKAGLPV